jgi:hypothetical protein
MEWLEAYEDINNQINEKKELIIKSRKIKRAKK